MTRYRLGCTKILKQTLLKLRWRSTTNILKTTSIIKSGATLVLNHHIETDVVGTKGKAYWRGTDDKKTNGQAQWLGKLYLVEGITEDG